MELTRQQIDELNDTVLRREIRLDAGDDAARIVAASFSSETPVARRFGNEVLVHEPEAMDLSRVKDGKLPLLAVHDDSQWPIGTAFAFSLDERARKWRGKLQFAETARAEEPFALHQQGVPLGVSVGYQLDWDSADYDKDTDTYRFRKWTPLEVSLVPIEADHNIGIGRNLEVSEMADEAGGNVPAKPAVIEAAPTDYKAAFAQGERKGATDAVQAERQRLIEIDAAFELPGVPQNDLMRALRATAAEGGWSPDQVRLEILKSLGTEETVRATVTANSETRDDTSPALRYQPPTRGGNSARVEAGEDALDKFADIAGRALEVRCGLKDQNKPADRDFVREVVDSGYASMSLLDMAREYLDIRGVKYRGLRGEEIAGKAFMTRASGHTTSDFTNLLNNVANKSLLMGWEEIPETWRTISRVGSLPDFKVADRPGLSHFSDLDEVPEDGDIAYGTMSDYKETIQLVEYAKKFRVSRRLIVNDDLEGLSRVPRLMGRAASRKVGDKVYDTLYSNSGVGPTLNQDSTALFDAAGHGNYVASGSGAAPAVATIDTGKTAMGTQTDPSGAAILNISPRYLIVPKALETTAMVLMNSQYDPAGTTASVSRRDSPNPFQNAFEVVAEARLDSANHGNNTTGWYLEADPGMFDTVEVAFLNGVAEPYLNQEEEWDTRGVEYVAGIDCGIAFLDFRGWYFNYGA